MRLAEAIRTRLTADEAVAAIVSGRVSWAYRKQGDPLPAIVLVLVGQDAPQHLRGDEDMVVSRVQVDCWAGNYLEAEALAVAARAALLPPAIVGDMQFWNGSEEALRDLGNVTDQGFVHRASLEMLLRHTAAS